MSFGKKKLLAVFLEKDNLKLLSYEIGGLKKTVTRLFAGQISFSPEVVRDGFIADPVKYDSQIKMAFAQKEALRDISEVVLFLSPDKTFTKTLASSDSIDTFIHSLPYFQEELVIESEVRKDRTTYVAFEKKLVEDAQRPFLDSGKKIVGIRSVANILVPKFARSGKYLLLIPLEKETVVIIAQDGEIGDLIVVKNEVLTARFGEFLGNHNLTTTAAYSVGTMPEAQTTKIKSENNIDVIPLAQTDVYDLIISAYSNASGGSNRPSLKLPGQKILFLAGAVIAGAVLTFLVVSNITKLSTAKVETPVSPPVKEEVPVVAPEPLPSDYSVEILNGTLVTGEAGKLAEVVKNLGFEVTGTKNATSAGFVATRLRTVSAVPEKIISQLESAILETYDSVALEPMATSSGKASIQIIIGKKK